MLMQLKSDLFDKPKYEIYFSPEETDMFIAWFSRIPETKVAIKLNGDLYRFASEQEKACFTYGLGHFYREGLKKRSIIAKLKQEIKEADGKINGMIADVKKWYRPSNYGELN
jgi:hypothetical protein